MVHFAKFAHAVLFVQHSQKATHVVALAQIYKLRSVHALLGSGRQTVGTMW